MLLLCMIVVAASTSAAPARRPGLSAEENEELDEILNRIREAFPVCMDKSEVVSWAEENVNHKFNKQEDGKFPLPCGDLEEALEVAPRGTKPSRAQQGKNMLQCARWFAEPLAGTSPKVGWVEERVNTPVVIVIVSVGATTVPLCVDVLFLVSFRDIFYSINHGDVTAEQ